MNIRLSLVVALAAALSGLHLEVACAQEPAPVNKAVVGITPAVPQCNDDRLKYDEPLHPKQRLCVFYHDVTAPTVIFGAIGAAGYAAFTNTESQTLGTGFESFSRGVATRYAQSATKSATEYLVDWAVNQDPRSSRHRGTAGYRFKAAAASLFITSKHSGRRFRPGPLAGAASGGFIALLWQQRNQQTVNGAFQHMGTSLAGSFAGAEFHEFEPEIMRWLNRHFEPKLK